MRAVILAAGAGRRMMPLTANRHKTLLSIGGRTIIDRLIDGLSENGVCQITVVTGYRAVELESHIRASFPELDVSFVRNEAYDSTNNIYSLAVAFEQLDFDEDVILLESDLIYEPAVLRRLIQSEHENVALVDRYRIGLDGTVVALSESDVVTEVIPASRQGPSFDFSDKYKTLNLYKFSAEFCRDTFSRLLTYYAKVIDDNCYYELILGILVYMQQVQIHAERLSGEVWAEVDDPNDLRGAEFVFVPADRQRHLETSWGGYWNTPIVDFAFIRNMYFPPASMVSQLKSYLPDLMVNYGSTQSILNEKLATYLLCDPLHVHFLNGASQFYPTLQKVFDSRQVLLPRPTFGEYERVFPGAATYRDDGQFSAAEVLRAAHDRDLIVVVSPNNPTGTTAPTQELMTLVREVPGKTILVDESFIDFSSEPSLLPWLEQVKPSNVILLKSLSKVLGVPGLRIGFVHTTQSDWAERIRSETPVWNINSVAEHFIELVLKYPSDLARSFTRTMVDRSRFAADLARLDIVNTVHAGGANFLLVRLNADSAEAQVLADVLLRKYDMYVKDVSSKFDDGGTYWRLAVRMPGENSKLCAAIAQAGSGQRRF